MRIIRSVECSPEIPRDHQIHKGFSPEEEREMVVDLKFQLLFPGIEIIVSVWYRNSEKKIWCVMDECLPKLPDAAISFEFFEENGVSTPNSVKEIFLEALALALCKKSRVKITRVGGDGGEIRILLSIGKFKTQGVAQESSAISVK